MKIYKNGRMQFDSDPELHVSRLESGALYIYAAKPDNTIANIWKRSVF